VTVTSAEPLPEVHADTLTSDIEAIRQRLVLARSGGIDDSEIRELGAAIRGIATELEAIRAARAKVIAERAAAAARREQLH
jgi:hypothetical protein